MTYINALCIDIITTRIKSASAHQPADVVATRRSFRRLISLKKLKTCPYSYGCVVIISHVDKRQHRDGVGFNALLGDLRQLRDSGVTDSDCEWITDADCHKHEERGAPGRVLL